MRKHDGLTDGVERLLNAWIYDKIVNPYAQKPNNDFSKGLSYFRTLKKKKIETLKKAFSA